MQATDRIDQKECWIKLTIAECFWLAKGWVLSVYVLFIATTLAYGNSIRQIITSIAVSFIGAAALGYIGTLLYPMVRCPCGHDVPLKDEICEKCRRIVPADI
jgi:hypothetical protein